MALLIESIKRKNSIVPEISFYFSDNKIIQRRYLSNQLKEKNRLFLK